ncbi:MAG: UGSC family (seleno)protein [Streptosporangiaceae bacterium]
MAETEPSYATLWPLGRSTERGRRGQAGLESWSGARIALVWDHLFKGDEILRAFEGRLGAQVADIEFIDHAHFVGDFGDDYSAFDTLREQLVHAKADAAVVAVGACGRCTAGVMRAVAVAEEANLPAVGVVSSGFEVMARSIASIFGDDEPRLAVYPGSIQTDTAETFGRKVRDVVLDQVEEALQRSKRGVAIEEVEVCPQPREVVFTGSLDEVEEHFLTKGWSDGLPIVPPTHDRVDRFLAVTSEDPDTILGALPPELREVTITNIAVNGVMAGCRPEYMPVLVAVARCLMDPRFRREDLTSTFGLEPLIVVSGPVVEALDFNTGTGAMRLGRQANGSIGRFLRLLLRNVGGLRIPPGTSDAGAIGYSFNVVMAEDEPATHAIGWDPFRVDNGFPLDSSTASVLLVTNHSAPIYTAGESAAEHLETIARILANAIGPWAYTAAVHGGFNPLLLLSPSVARALHEFGVDKKEIRAYLYEQLRIRADVTERYAHQVGRTDFSFATSIDDPVLRESWVASQDPARLVPMLIDPDWTSIVIGGNPGRNQSRAYVGNLVAGPPVTHRIE